MADFGCGKLLQLDGICVMIYLDYNATTPVAPEVQDAITSALAQAWGNPSSSHEAGKMAKTIIDGARDSVAQMIGAKASDIVFTSGGTEANNMIIHSALKYFKMISRTNMLFGDGGHLSALPHIISSLMEHPAVNVVLHHLQETGKAEVTYVPLSHLTGRLEVTDVLSAVRPNTILVTVMLANNETGIIQPVADICKAIGQLERGPGETRRILVHSDTAQAIGKIPVNIDTLGVDYLTVVGHKFYGPRIGAVYACDLDPAGTPLYPILFGGGQERNFRPGTENTCMIAGLGKACELVHQHLQVYESHMREVASYLESRLKETFPADKIHINGKFPGSERLPNTCNVSILGDGLEGHKVLGRCKVLQASVGAACHSQNRASPILLAIGISEEIAKNALRLSTGRDTTKADIDVVVADILQAINSLTAEGNETK